MKITLAKSAGFCFGVKRALNIAFQTASSQGKVYMLGDLVHNEEVIKEIEKAGIKKIKRLSYGKGKMLLIRAHGAGDSTIQKALCQGYKIVDATCPMVKEIHKIAQGLERQGCRIIVIGDKKHEEVRGIVGQLKIKAIVIDALKNIPIKSIKGIKKAGVVVQSTQNIDQVNKIIKVLKKYIKEVIFFNTICAPTRQKQDEIKKMPLKNCVIIIIGSKTSANTKRLYEIAKQLNQKSYWVSSKKEINPDWFKGAKRVGVTAGASTPDSTTQDIINYINQIRRDF